MLTPQWFQQERSSSGALPEAVRTTARARGVGGLVRARRVQLGRGESPRRSCRGAQKGCFVALCTTREGGEGNSDVRTFFAFFHSRKTESGRSREEGRKRKKDEGMAYSLINSRSSASTASRCASMGPPLFGPCAEQPKRKEKKRKDGCSDDVICTEQADVYVRRSFSPWTPSLLPCMMHARLALANII